MLALITALIVFLATVLLILALRPIAVSIGLTDQPDLRKQHSGSIPLVGGIAIYLALVTGVLFGAWATDALPFIFRQVFSFLAAGFLLVVIGVWDDLRGLSPSLRLVVQSIAGLIMVFGADMVIRDLGAILPSGEVLVLGGLAVPFTVFVVVGVINAVNMCDGLDGLSGNLTLVTLLGLGAASAMFGSADIGVLLNILSGAVAGFLVFNQRMIWRPKASVFLGDAGSMLLGFSLVWIIVDLCQEPARSISPAASLWFLLVPVYDTVGAIVRRLASGYSPLHPDVRHIHHLFIRAGFSVSETIFSLSVVSASGMAIGITATAYGTPELRLVGVFVFGWLLFLWYTQRAWRTGRFLGRKLAQR